MMQNILFRRLACPAAGAARQRLHPHDKLDTKSIPLNGHIKEKGEETKTIKEKERRNGSEVPI